ncbi:helix-turn-helix transcriptional regulator [Asticcacaulis sp.]|uniref:helix-turn-helix domain-containing protein n=1 Tax=Asticcacaulis sp. TaxID=1872648 RepID=UPI002BAF31E0|nr:helix-turn-helix transcriptional regulator [Asticcacaulis sp.]HTM82201.1 helix-turn-helix transcriptional regulator [Asticcacaulis sp.]
MKLADLVGWNLNRIRLDAEMTQEELSHRCEIIHQGFISDLENGKHNASIETLVILANALDVTISEFYSLNRAPSNLTTGPLIVETRNHGTKVLDIDPKVYGLPKLTPNNG